MSDNGKKIKEITERLDYLDTIMDKNILDEEILTSILDELGELREFLENVDIKAES
jgi:hypothetical protein